ncbi:RhuM family protein [Thermodesulfobacteriota bacterium]
MNQIAALFDRNKSVISRHLNNIFKSGELQRDAVVAKKATTAADGKTYQVEYFNLDAIISVGYRVNSIRGTHFRIWATSVLKDHLIQGYTVNERRLAEKGLIEMEQAISLLSQTLQSRELITDQGKAVLSVITLYDKSICYVIIRLL